MAVVPAVLMLTSPAWADRPVLRLCADPNNMPFSDRAERGFDNQIGALLAHELGATPRYYWWAQRRGFVRNTLSAGTCDVMVGAMPGMARVRTTLPYYRSTYVFVSRRDRHYDIASFDDPRLRSLRIGIHVIGADYNSLPPGVALAARRIVGNVVGYSIYGNYADESPPSKLVEAVVRGAVDVAVVWGPLAGYYARRSTVPLSIVPVADRDAVPGIPFIYDIAVGVRPGDGILARRIERALARRRTDIRHILQAFSVPLASPASVAIDASAAGSSASPSGVTIGGYSPCP
jgi:mxaJ protein